MHTAQIDLKTKTVFAIVYPQVKTLAPKGTAFYHFDPNVERIQLGDAWDTVANKPKKGK